jgi:hypothetical protein
VGDRVRATNTVNEYVVLSDLIAVSGQNAESDSINFKLAVDSREIAQYWVGDVSKFFGIVYPYELEVISNGAVTRDSNDRSASKSFDNIELYGNEVPITDVYYEDSARSSSDIDISADDKNFQYIDNAWWFNIALHKGKERMVDHYIKVKVVVKNFVTNPSESINKVKRIVYLKTMYRKKL